MRDQFLRTSSIALIPARHEQGAAFSGPFFPRSERLLKYATREVNRQTRHLDQLVLSPSGPDTRDHLYVQEIVTEKLSNRLGLCHSGASCIDDHLCQN